MLFKFQDFQINPPTLFNNLKNNIDQNSIGTIISYLGYTPPYGYLACDGKEYGIADYLDLATLINNEFGKVNYFGGDGESTFAVPDLRNLFLRGYHGEAEQQLSENIGIKQEGTLVPNIYIADYGKHAYAFTNGNQSGFKNYENNTNIPKVKTLTTIGATVSIYNTANSENYQVRPTNMAVLYCIKAIKSEPILEEYDTDDGWHIRKWLDGYVELSFLDSMDITKSQWTTLGSLKRFANATKVPPMPLNLIKTYSCIASVFSDDYELIPTATEYKSDFINISLYSPVEVPITIKATTTLLITGKWQ